MMIKASPSLSNAYEVDCWRSGVGKRHPSGHLLRLVDGTIESWGENGWRGTYECLDCGNRWTKFTSWSAGEN